MDKSELYYVFSEGAEYIIIACEGKEESSANIIINLYDREDRLIASTCREDGEVFSNLKFLCSATGLYYMRVQFKNSKSGCGMCILGIKQ